MSVSAAAITNHDVADFLSNFVTVFLIVIFVRILSSWLPRRPTTGPIRAVLEFAEQTADPYLNVFRRFIRPMGGGAFALDLSPIVAILVLTIGSGILIGAVDNL
ncbi:MAG: YggT family protein [Solirubrobacterales bacterium]